MVKSWAEIKKTKDENKPISTEIIWNNSQIKILDKTLFKKEWFTKGIKYIKHIYNYEQNNFYPFLSLVDMYNIPSADFLNYKIIKFLGK